MPIAERWKIEACLALVKQVDVGKLIVPGMKDANSKTGKCVSSLGFTASDILAVMKSLTVADYSDGPLADDKGRPHDLWVFGKRVQCGLVYIKFAVFYENGAVIGICVSFHVPEYEMRFPYKEA